MGNPWIKWAAVALGLLVLAFIITATILGWWPVVLDIVLIIAALVSIALLGFLIWAVLNLTRTIVQVKDELMPVLENAKTTTNAVREGAKTATVFGVDPAVRTAGLMAGAGQVAAVILGRGEAHKRAERRQKRRREIERELAAREELNGYR
jgi:hypothetical protein